MSTLTKKGMLILSALLLVAVFAIPALATDYYVAATGGNDDGPGTATQPWASIDNGDVKGILLPGDTVIVKTGTYAPRGDTFGITIEKCSGTSTSPITYKAEESGMATISFTSSDWSTGCFVLRGGAHDIVIDGFELLATQNGVIARDINTATPSFLSDNIEVKNCWISSMGQAGIYLNDNAGLTSKNWKIHNNYFYNITAGHGGIFVNSFIENISVYNNTFNNVLSAVRDGSVQLRNKGKIIFKNNIVANCTVAGLRDEILPCGIVNSYNLYYGNAKDYMGTVKAGSHEFNADPMFVDPSSYDYSLNTGSPAIDAGDAAGLDLGAVESGDATGVGWVTGTVTVNGVAKKGVLVSSGTTRALTGADGTYWMILPEGTNTLTASAATSVSILGSATGTVNVVAGDPAEVKNFAITYTPKTYYISATGDDTTGDGTAAKPWKSINKPDQDMVLLPGDTVSVAAGTYTPAYDEANGIFGVMINKCSGDPEYPITYKANGQAIVDGGAFGGTDRRISCFYIGNVSAYHTGSGPHYNAYIVLDGFDITNSTNGILTVDTTGLTVKNCFIHDGHAWLNPANGYTYGSSIWVEGGNDTYIYNNKIHEWRSEARGGGIFDWGFCGPNWENWYPLEGNNWYVNNVIDNVIYGYYEGGHARSALVNNIFSNVYGNAIQHWYGGTPTRATNLYYECWDDVMFYGYAGPFWEFKGNPKFVNESGLDFHLQATSPAINAGTDVEILPFNGPAPDLGMYETTDTTKIGWVEGAITHDGAVYTGGTCSFLTGPYAECVDNGLFSLERNDGKYRLQLPVGTHQIRGRIGAHKGVIQNVTITDGATVTMDLDVAGDDPQTYYCQGNHDWNIGYGREAREGTTPETAVCNPDSYDRRKELMPGDTIVLVPGGIKGYIGIQWYSSWNAFQFCSGTPEKPITITSQPGAYVMNDANTSGSFLFNNGVHDYVVDGVEFRSGGEPIVTGTSSDITIKNCYIHDCGTSVRLETPTNWTFTRNVFKNVATGDVNRGAITDNAGINTQVINNTFVGCQAALVSQVASTFKNNIVDSCITVGIKGASVVHDYNLFNNGAVLNYDTGMTAGANEITGDPLFVDRANSDFRLSEGSPAIDAGDPAGVDLGAFEGAVSNFKSVATIALAKAEADGQGVEITSAKVVTAVFAGFFYVEEPDRFAGIKVVGTGVTQGDKITFKGTLGVDANNERVITLSGITSQTSGTSVDALGMNGKDIARATATGLLTRIWGKVTFVATDNSYCYVDDGAGNKDGSYNGIKVVLTGLTNIPAANSYAKVTGIASTAAGKTVILPRADSDIN